MKVLHIPLQVTFIPGKSNCLVDILSREPCFVPTQQILNEHYKSQKLSNRPYKKKASSMDSVYVKADAACFEHEVLIDETLAKELQSTPVPVCLQVLTRSKSKLKMESQGSEQTVTDCGGGGENGGGGGDSSHARATTPAAAVHSDHDYVALQEPTVARRAATTVSGSADRLFQSLLEVCMHDVKYQGICAALRKKVVYRNLPTDIKAEIPKNIYEKMSIFDYRNIRTLANHPETQKYAMRIAKIYLLANSKQNCNNISAFAKGLILVNNKQMYVPVSARAEILRRIHMAHGGYIKMIQRVRPNFWWKNLSKQVKDLVALCTVCINHRPALPPAPRITSYPLTASPWEAIGMDIFYGPKNTYFLSILDSFSTFPFCQQIKDMTTKSVLKALQPLMNIFGIPVRIRTDAAQCFLSADWDKFITQNAIHHEVTSSYHASSNGHAEQGVCISKKLLSKLDWNFPEFEKQLMHYRAAPRPDGFAPSELFLARKLRTNLPLPPGAYSLNVSRAVDAGNNRLSNFTHLQDKSGGRPLEEVPVGSDVAVYNYSQSMPRWSSRGKVVATERNASNGTTKYVVALYGGQTAPWQKHSKTRESVVRRSRIHILPISNNEIGSDNFLTEKFGNLQLAEPFPQESYNQIRNHVKTVFSPIMGTENGQKVLKKLSLFEENRLQLVTINRLQQIIETNSEAAKLEDSFNFLAVNNEKERFDKSVTNHLLRLNPVPKSDLDEPERPDRPKRPNYGPEMGPFMGAEKPPEFWATQASPKITIPKVEVTAQYLDFSDGDDKYLTAVDQLHSELEAQRSQAAVQCSKQPAQAVAPATYAEVAGRESSAPAAAPRLSPIRAPRLRNTGGRKTGARRKAKADVRSKVAEFGSLDEKPSKKKVTIITAATTY